MKRAIIAIIIAIVMFLIGFFLGYRETVLTGIIQITGPHTATFEAWGQVDEYIID